jgi:hypothetical protein
MKKEYVKVSGHSDLVRDPETNSIINKNKSEYNEYMMRKNLKSEENQKVQTIEDEVASIKSDVNEIKSLLRELINGFK